MFTSRWGARVMSLRVALCTRRLTGKAQQRKAFTISTVQTMCPKSALNCTDPKRLVLAIQEAGAGAGAGRDPCTRSVPRHSKLVLIQNSTASKTRTVAISGTTVRGFEQGRVLEAEERVSWLILWH